MPSATPACTCPTTRPDTLKPRNLVINPAASGRTVQQAERDPRQQRQRAHVLQRHGVRHADRRAAGGVHRLRFDMWFGPICLRQSHSNIVPVLSWYCPGFRIVPVGGVHRLRFGVVHIWLGPGIVSVMVLVLVWFGPGTVPV
jgi:hypothetical protein